MVCLKFILQLYHPQPRLGAEVFNYDWDFLTSEIFQMAISRILGRQLEKIYKIPTWGDGKRTETED